MRIRALAESTCTGAVPCNTRGSAALPKPLPLLHHALRGRGPRRSLIGVREPDHVRPQDIGAMCGIVGCVPSGDRSDDVVHPGTLLPHPGPEDSGFYSARGGTFHFILGDVASQ